MLQSTRVLSLIFQSNKNSFYLKNILKKEKIKLIIKYKFI